MGYQICHFSLKYGQCRSRFSRFIVFSADNQLRSDEMLTISQINHVYLTCNLEHAVQHFNFTS